MSSAAPSSGVREDAFTVTITPKQIYDKVTDLEAAVVRSLDRAEETTLKLNDHEVRIRSIEGRLWPLPTLAALLGLAGLVISIIQKFSGG